MKECTTFGALLKPLSKSLIEEAAKRFNADYYCKKFKTREHLLVMLYAQLHDLKSLRDLAVGFRNTNKELSPLQKVKRSTLSDANHRRPAECFLWIVEQLMSLLPRKKRKELKKIVKKLDSSPIQLKGKNYDEWTLGSRTLRCQGLKLHIEYEGAIKMPTGVKISQANVDDCRMGQSWPIKQDTVYVFDKGYCDYNWWWKIEQKEAFFVTRLKSHAGIRMIKKLKVEGKTVLEDGLFEFKNKAAGGKKNEYRKALRRVVVKREGKNKPLVLVSNLNDVPAETIAELYKERWGIELFFKWIKQNLRVKKFLGQTENAVKLQIGAALIVYLLIGIFKWKTKSKLSLHQLLIWVRQNDNKKKSIYRGMKPPDYQFQKKLFSGGQL